MFDKQTQLVLCLLSFIYPFFVESISIKYMIWWISGGRTTCSEIICLDILPEPGARFGIVQFLSSNKKKKRFETWKGRSEVYNICLQGNWHAENVDTSCKTRKLTFNNSARHLKKKNQWGSLIFEVIIWWKEIRICAGQSHSCAASTIWYPDTMVSFLNFMQLRQIG